MEIKVLSDNVSYKKEENTHILDFGDIPKGSKPTVDINISGVENLTLTSTCGCTVVQADKDGNASISYNREGEFGKIIKVSYKKDGKEQQSEIKIKGNVN